ncbi:MAG: leucyl/phenylalanyl-tRNA--protein transferase [Phycisphaerales bacterium JB039]
MRPTDAEISRALLAAYREGAFPMGEGDRVGLYRPDPRAILPLDGLRLSRSLRAAIRSGRFRIRSDTAVEAVVRACAEPAPGREETWLSPPLLEAYLALGRQGHVHTVEAWLAGPEEQRLVGGLYGVAIGGLFAGESMFSRPEEGGTDASKVCLAHLQGHLLRRGFALHDVQFVTPHLERLGAVEIPGARYLALLGEAVELAATWGSFDAAAALAALDAAGGGDCAAGG